MTVYVIQKQMMVDKKTGELVDRYGSINKAENWGKLEYVLPPHAHKFESQQTLDLLHEKLADFSDEDYLLLIGSPSIIGMATAIAARNNNGYVNFLQWNTRTSEYMEISAKIY